MTDTPVEALEPEALEAAARQLPHVCPGLFEDQTQRPGGGWLRPAWTPNERSRTVAESVVRAYLGALSTPPHAPGVVKALEWEVNSGSSWWTGELLFGVYYVVYDEGNGFRASRQQFLSEAGSDEIAYSRSLDEAKAAAQADFQQRILSTLVSTPPVSAGELVDGRRPGKSKLVYNKATRTIDTVSAPVSGEVGELVERLRTRADTDERMYYRDSFLLRKAADALTAANADRDRLEKERDALRVALCRYGDPYRMSNAPPELQQFIDAAFANRSLTPTGGPTPDDGGRQ